MRVRQVFRRYVLRWSGPFLMIFWLVSLNGCRLIGGGDPAPPGKLPPSAVPHGVVYHGTLTLDGGQISAGLELREEGGRDVWAALETVSGLRAEGAGRVRGESLEISLSYGGDCPGEIALNGPWDREAGVFEGSAEASDCTGAASGTFRLVSGRPVHDLSTLSSHMD